MTLLVIIHTQLCQELHEEGTVQIFAQLIQHKPELMNKTIVSSSIYSNILPISEFTLFEVSFNSYQF